MSALSQIGAMFASFWRIFELNHPLLQIPFGAILLGWFITNLAIKILVPILGIGEKGSKLNRDRRSVKHDAKHDDS